VVYGVGEDLVTPLAVGDTVFWIAAADPDIGRFIPAR